MTLVQPTTEVVPVAGGGGTPARPDARLIRERYDKGTKAIRPEQLDYEQNCAFIQGNQWVYVNWQSQQVVISPRKDKRARMTFNRLFPECRAIIAKAVQRELTFEVPPDAADDAHIRGARVAEGVLTHTARNMDWELHREQLAWVILKGGTGILCLDWDAQAGEELSFDPATLRPISTGEIKMTTLAITECATEPGTRDARYANWWVKAQALPPEEVRIMYGLKEDPARDASAALSPVQSKVMQTNSRAGSGSANPLDLTLVLTYYERPNPRNKTGTVAVVVGNDIVDGPYPWPFPFTDRLNIAVGRETIVESRWTGNTILSAAVPIQTALNAGISSITEHMKIAGNARLFAQEVDADLVENFTNQAGEVQFYRDKIPEWRSPPQMPDWWNRYIEQISAQMDDTLGRHDVSRGQAPRNIESGLGVQMLIEQDETPTGHLVRVIADTFGDFASLVLKTYEKKVLPEEQRKATIARPGYPSESTTWNGASFMGQTYARVPYEAIAPLNEAARFQRAVLLKQIEIIKTDSQFAAYVDMPGGTGLMEEINFHVAKARRENHAMLLAETMIPAMWDNHALHIEEHNHERSSATYEHLDEQKRRMFDLHVQAHSTLAAEEAGMQTGKTTYAPELAAAAQATQPPGSEMPGLPGAPGALGMPETEANNTPTPGGRGAPQSEPVAPGPMA